MKTRRKIIKIDEELCDGCGQCVIQCAEGALKIVDGVAKVISDNLCDGLGACIGECPAGALEIVEREADEFDEDAVEKHLKHTTACGCPSAAVQALAPSSDCRKANLPSSCEGGESLLTHWPIKIRLVPPGAPFLKGADLLVLADCCGVAYPSLHQDLLKGRVIMMGCPKFDNYQEYIDKFADIFQVADIKSITCVVMEVPCCSGMPVIIKKGMEKAGKNIDMKEVVISARGQIINRG
jgi:NAD-dependent dihydropyrimidine dehydrogenase PreA subunit